MRNTDSRPRVPREHGCPRDAATQDTPGDKAQFAQGPALWPAPREHLSRPGPSWDPPAPTDPAASLPLSESRRSRRPNDRQTRRKGRKVGLLSLKTCVLMTPTQRTAERGPYVNSVPRGDSASAPAGSAASVPHAAVFRRRPRDLLTSPLKSGPLHPRHPSPHLPSGAPQRGLCI